MTTQAVTYPGQLDQTFGTNGIVLVNIPGYSSLRIESIKSDGLGPERKIYFAGWCENDLQPDALYVLGRLNSDGELDTTFGENKDGLVTGQFAGLNSEAKSLALQSDGKILLFGKALSSESPPAFARFTTDGILDKSFGAGGYTVLEIVLAPPAPAPKHQTIQPATESTASPSGIEILPDGKILAFQSYVFQSGQAVGLIIRLTEKGTVDLDFNQLGYIPVIHPAFLSQATHLANIMVQADGMYLGCGATWDFVKPHNAMFVRLDTDGNLDTSFGSKKDGFVLIEAPAAANGIRIEHMVQQPNNRILGVGNTFTSPNRMAVLTSIEPDGTPNIQFNRGMPLYTSLEQGATTLWMGGAIQNDGKIVVVGGVGLPNGEVDIVVARFIDGAFDPSFNNGKGWVGTHLEDGTEAATGMALQDDGKILVSAYIESSKGVILRYLS